MIVITPCRLRSTRFPNKGLCLLNGKPLIYRAAMNGLSIPGVQKVLVGTSSDVSDDELLKVEFPVGVEVVRGSEEDVLGRFMPALLENNPEYVIRATGDCPMVSSELASILIESHKQTGSDITYTDSRIALGISCEIYKFSALKKLKELMPETLHSEYLIYYFTNNPQIFKVNSVSVPEKFIQSWRLTLDERNDWELLDKIYTDLEVSSRPIDFDEVIQFFAKNPGIESINNSNVVKYRDNHELITYLKSATTIKMP